MPVFDVRSLVIIGVFGALWGAAELSVGSVLHAMRVPFSGLVMAAIGVAIVLAGHRFVPRRGAVLQMGLVTAAVKSASIGGIVINPILGILAETLVVEAVVDVTQARKLWHLALAGALACLWPLVHPFVVQGLMAGAGVWTVWGWTVEKGAAALHLPGSSVAIIVALLVLVHVLAGAAAGTVAWSVAHSVRRRLGLRHANA